jgi:hypothetical protein
MRPDILSGIFSGILSAIYSDNYIWKNLAFYLAFYFLLSVRVHTCPDCRGARHGLR